jgi:L-fuconolactonase
LIYPRQLPAAIELVAKLPEQKFVVDHLAKPEIRAKKIELWAALIRELAVNPNVYCKLSGMVTEADWKKWKSEDFEPYLDVVFDAFGADRLMFGSDWPVCLVAATFSQVKNIVESYVNRHESNAKANILGGNAVRVYGLRNR